MTKPRRERLPPPAGVRGLRAYEEAVLLAELTHAATRGFWRHGSGRLATQMRDAAESVYANMAEGHGRPTTADRARFLAIAWSSPLELESRLQHTAGCGLLARERATELRDRCRWTGRLLAGLRRHPGR